MDFFLNIDNDILIRKYTLHGNGNLVCPYDIERNLFWKISRAALCFLWRPVASLFLSSSVVSCNILCFGTKIGLRLFHERPDHTEDEARGRGSGEWVRRREWPHVPLEWLQLGQRACWVRRLQEAAIAPGAAVSLRTAAVTPPTELWTQGTSSEIMRSTSCWCELT